MSSVEIPVPGQPGRTRAILPVVLLDPITGDAVGPGGGGGGSGADRELVVTTYSAKNAFAGASAGDTITMTQVLDVSGTPTTVATIWRNQSSGQDLGSVPNAANLNLVGSGGASEVTLAQVRDSVGAPDNAPSESPVTPASLNGIAKGLWVNFGRSTDAAVGDGSEPATAMSLFRGILNTLVFSVVSRMPTLGQKNSAGSAPVVLSSDGNWARENYFTGRIATTTGNAYPSTACSMLDIHNTAQGAVDIQYQVGSTGEWMDIPAGYSDLVRGISNANQVAIRRTDGGTSVTVKAVLYATAG